MAATTHSHRILLFAGVAQRAGAREWRVDVAAGSTVAELREELARRHPWLRELPVAFAVNQALAAPTTRLAAGDELALLPPVSGG
ncbi:MAG: MoaD/ThiS family protein [Planctomycetes bacterium]|nr:MoaD/ThiS family protein [Planctomycetota bacterium]